MGKYCKLTIIIIIANIIYYLGTVHIITGNSWPIICKQLVYSTIKNCRVVEKDSWTLRETLINYDRVSKLPYIIAKSDYPIFMFWIEGEIEFHKFMEKNQNKLEKLQKKNQIALNRIR